MRMKYLSFLLGASTGGIVFGQSLFFLDHQAGVIGTILGFFSGGVIGFLLEENWILRRNINEIKTATN